MSDGQVTPPKIALETVAVVRAGRLILQKLSFSAQAGDIIWLRGANGSGKSTLLRLLAGLLVPASGNLSVAGKIALIDETHPLDHDQTLENALGFWAKIDGSNATLQQEALTAFDLTGLAEIPVGYLSTGQRKRASLARLVNCGADIWLLDEPYNGLDSANIRRLDDRLLKHAQNGGIAIVAAHQPSSINVAATISLDELKASISA
jgi:heme exporter protein A